MNVCIDPSYGVVSGPLQAGQHLQPIGRHGQSTIGNREPDTANEER